MGKNLPEDVFMQIAHENRLPPFLEAEIRQWIRTYTQDLPDVEFVALRALWSDTAKLLDKHFYESPEAQSARELVTTLISATNARYYEMGDTAQVTVSDIIAENELLKKRVAELEAQLNASQSHELYRRQVTPFIMSTPRNMSIMYRDAEEEAKDRHQKAKDIADAQAKFREQQTRDALEREKERRLHDTAYMLGIRIGAPLPENALLTFADYQRQASETAVYKTSIFEGLGVEDDESNLARLLKLSYTVLGLAGEVGEFANIVKKIERNGKSIDEMLEKLVDKLGDVMWYVFACADEIGVPAEFVARGNIEKLAKRKAEKIIHDNGNR